jgi:Na+-transporting NADH:ubiquinone oxidoreductase subunit NqrB
LPLVKKWQALLGITDWIILCKSIFENQVVDELEGNTSGHEFIGIHINFKKKLESYTIQKN